MLNIFKYFRLIGWLIGASVLTVSLAACVHQTPPKHPQQRSNIMFNEKETALIEKETALIEKALNHYIEGTSVEDPERLRMAFHPNFNLYAVRRDGSLRVWDGQEYIGNFKKGDVNSRIGRIISVDFENDIAVAKAEILIPDSRLFIDYFLLAKYEGQWRIIHKAYTSKPLNDR